MGRLINPVKISVSKQESNIHFKEKMVLVQEEANE
jgi:hypothetical protein